jgi:serine/threonine protein kinase
MDLYERKELIGVGHHARVYRCRHQQDKKEYAIKVVDQLQQQPNYDLFKSRYLELMPRLKALTHHKIMSLLHF